jgi:hypothetical protein
VLKIYYLIKRFITYKVLYLPYNIKEFYLRGKRGYGNSDASQFSFFLTERMPDILRYIKKNSFAYPGYDDADTPEKWDTLLDTLIEGWEAGKRYINDDYIFKIDKDFYIKKWPTDEQVKECLDMAEKDKDTFEAMMPIFVKWFFSLDVG